MTDISFVTTVPRVQARTAAGDIVATPGGQLPPVAVVVGIPGRDGKDGRDGRDGQDATNSDGTPVDPGDLTLIFNNVLIG